MELSDKKIVLVERNEKVVYQDGNRIVKAFKPSKAASDVFNEAVSLPPFRPVNSPDWTR